ncbi:hypothetical protein ACHQM5_030219 [Ranunculus cassubicifolius]
MKNQHFTHLFLVSFMVLVQLSNTQDAGGVTEFHVGVILDMETWVAKVSNSCMYMALSDFYSTHADYKTRLVLHTEDSKSDVLGAAFAAMELIKDYEVDVIMGPQRSDQTEFVVDLGSKLHIPVISFSATIPSIYSRSNYFIRTTPDDHTQVKAIASIAQAFRWRQVILVHEDTDYGNRLVPYLINAFQETNTRIACRKAISPSATDDQISVELKELVAMQTSIFVVHMSASFGAEFFLKAKARGMMDAGYVWIITNGLMNVLESMKSNIISSMQGVLGVNPYSQRSNKVESFTSRWRRKFIEDNPDVLDAEMITFGLQAYDSTWALAMAAERIEGLKSSLKDENSTKFLGMKVSQTGPKLLEEIKKTEFEGLSGDFLLVDGQLKPAAIQILNVIGKGGREIGFWTLDQGISREFPFRSDRTYSTSAESFRGIIWPGETTNVPKGWVIPMDGKLKIGVPVHDGFRELVNVTRDPYTNATKVTGYCIDVFIAAIESLDYSIPYEFVPIEREDGSYNDLIDQVYNQSYDAVVGDVTITANRSLYVDFSFPYTDGGVWMIVPLQQPENTKSKWTGLQSTVRTVGFIILIIFIIALLSLSVLEGGLEGIFSTASSHQFIGEVSNALSTISPEYKKKFVSFLSMLTAVLWIFLIIALTVNCMVTLSSMFTIEQLEVTVADFNDLREKGDYVGYRRGSFVYDVLKRSHFDESKLKSYSSPEECHDLLASGSENGGVSAVFDEMPYISIFLSKYCSQYTKVGPTHKTDGYGFVFPLGSPLVSDMSNAVLGVTEGNKLNDIINTWFPPNKTCSEERRWTIPSSTNRTSLLWIIICVVLLSYIFTSSCMVKKKQKQS